MYNKNDLQFVGKHDFNKEETMKYASWHVVSVSVNIFKWGLTANKKQMKPLKCVVRLTGSPKKLDDLFSRAEQIVKLLDEGNWHGAKTEKLKP